MAEEEKTTLMGGGSELKIVEKTPQEKKIETAFNKIWKEEGAEVELDGVFDWRASQLLKALCLSFFEVGTEWQKEQILKDAVDVKVVESYGCEKGEDGEWRRVVTPVISFETADFSIGDKVKIVIIPIKEDKE